MPATPSTANYYIGKGVVSFKRAGTSTWLDLGNCPTFEYTPSVTKIDHFSSRFGIKQKDRSIVTEKSGTLNIVLDEWTPDNLALALLGDIDTNTAGQPEIAIFSETSIIGEVKFVGANDVGPQYTWHFVQVELVPSKALGAINDALGQITLDGDVQADESGVFGTCTRTADGSL